MAPGSAASHSRATATSWPSVISSASWWPVYHATATRVSQTTSRAPSVQFQRWRQSSRWARTSGMTGGLTEWPSVRRSWMHPSAYDLSRQPGAGLLGAARRCAHARAGTGGVASSRGMK